MLIEGMKPEDLLVMAANLSLNNKKYGLFGFTQTGVGFELG
jgi:hypothetical protein